MPSRSRFFQEAPGRFAGPSLSARQAFGLAPVPSLRYPLRGPEPVGSASLRLGAGSYFNVERWTLNVERSAPLGVQLLHRLFRSPPEGPGNASNPQFYATEEPRHDDATF